MFTFSSLPFPGAAVFKTAGDTLSRPLPHVYQADQQGSAIPIVPPDELRQDVASSMGTAVRVQNFSSISQKHVSHDTAGCVVPPHHLTPPECHEAALSHFSHVDKLPGFAFISSERELKDTDEFSLTMSGLHGAGIQVA